ncbi:MAG TPA: hypothetical protein VGR69_05155 [Candidatus Rubrimentiphilum sp.]|nr:hypothetical protein [Candidatus Rubrimentiphilum sp.]
MARAPGWTKLAATALELAALAFGSFAMELARKDMPHQKPETMRPPTPAPQPPPAPRMEPVAQTPPSREPWELHPRDFLTDIHDEGANYYRASDDSVQLVAGLYSDGRIRLADESGRRFAGALIAGHADLLELRNNEWSEVFLRVTPTGRMQLELRGGPYDSHVLTCEPLPE